MPYRYCPDTPNDPFGSTAGVPSGIGPNNPPPTGPNEIWWAPYDPTQVPDGPPGAGYKNGLLYGYFGMLEVFKCPVEADLANLDLVLRPGMYATVKIGVEKHAGVLLLPVEAILVEKAGVSVFTLAEGKAMKTPVQVGFNDGAFVEIVKGLPENSPIILVGRMTLLNGQAVNVAEAK